MAYRPHRVADDRIAISTKYGEVLEQIATHFPGEVTYLLETMDERVADQTDEVAMDELPVRAVPFRRDRIQRSDFPSDAVVMAALEGGLMHLADHVSDASHRLVRGCDNPARVAGEIIWHTPGPLPGKVKGMLWAAREHRRQVREVRQAASVHSNGYRGDEVFAPYVDDRLVYFDTRLERADLPTDDQLDARRKRFLSGEPLHLCFSGRLDPIKSPLDLVAVGDELRAGGVPFRFTILGDGPLRQQVEERIRDAQLGAAFELRGFVDFSPTLLQFMRDDADLFVCTHRQGDSSSTYLEMMGCGVPVASYPNSAISAMHRRDRVGTLSAEKTPSSLATAITSLHRDRAALVDLATTCHTFGRARTVETAWSAQMGHMAELWDRHVRPNGA